MDVISNIKKRTSWRTYTKDKLDRHLIEKIENSLVGSQIGPLENQVIVYFFKKAITEKQKLGTYGMVKNAQYFLGGEIIPEKGAFLDFGYILEKAVIYLTDLGLGSCWLGGTFKRSNFMEAVNVDEKKIMPAVISLGYPKSKKSIRDRLISFNAGSSKRKPWKKLFFDENVATPLRKNKAGQYEEVLEMVRQAPSASNLQPWRIIKKKNHFHLFLKRKKLYEKIIKSVDLQMIDMGIAMYHFEASARQIGLSGEWVKAPLKIDENWEYIISWSATQ